MNSDAKKMQAAFWLDYSHQLSTAIRYLEALRAVEQAIALDESNAEAWYVKGTCLAMLARYEEALQDFEHALQLERSLCASMGWQGMGIGYPGPENSGSSSR